MNPARSEYLLTQYVLAIQNEGEWYKQVAPCVDRGDFELFRGETYLYIKRLARDLRETTSIRDRAFIYCELWKSLDGKPSVLRNVPRELGAVLRDLLDGPIPTPTTTPEPELKKEIIMAIPFETKHFVFGTDTKSMTDEQLIDSIKQVEAEIAALGVVKTSSKKIAAKKAELETMLANIVETLDAR